MYNLSVYISIYIEKVETNITKKNQIKLKIRLLSN